jgi:hypothetical protein
MAAPRKKRTETSPSADMSTECTPYVYNNVVIGLIPVLQELAAWWQSRKDALTQACDTTQETERITFHVERRWIEAIRRQADLDGLTITQVANAAFRQHFERP